MKGIVKHKAPPGDQCLATRPLDHHATRFGIRVFHLPHPTRPPFCFSAADLSVRRCTLAVVLVAWLGPRRFRASPTKVFGRRSWCCFVP